MFQADERAIQLAPNNAAVAGRRAQNLLWGGNCSREAIMDIDAPPGKYVDGDCRWQTGVESGVLANKLDTANIHAFENYSLSCHYVVKKDYNEVLRLMGQVPAPGFLWWDLYVGSSYDGLGNKGQRTV